MYPVGESECGGPDCSVPGNGTVAAVFDHLSGFNGSKRDFKISELLDLGIVLSGGQLSTEDCIKVDGSPTDNVLPL